MTEKANFIESIARQLSQQVSDAISIVLSNLVDKKDATASSINPDELSTKLKPIIEPILEKFRLVPMAEFEAQSKLLENLNDQIQSLEARLNTVDDSGPETTKDPEN